MQSISRIVSSFYVHASTYNTVTPPSIKDIVERVMTLLNDVLFMIGPIILVIMITYAGFLRVGSATDPARLKTSTDIITWSIAGYVVSIAAFLIVKLVVTALGLDTTGFGTIDLPI